MRWTIAILIGVLCLSTVSASLVQDYTRVESSVYTPKMITGSFTNSMRPIPERYGEGECYHDLGKGTVCTEDGIRLPYYDRFQTGEETTSRSYISTNNNTLVSFGGKFGRFGRMAFDTDSIGDLREGYAIQGKFRGRESFDYHPTSYVGYMISQQE